MWRCNFFWSLVFFLLSLPWIIAFILILKFNDELFKFWYTKKGIFAALNTLNQKMLIHHSVREVSKFFSIMVSVSHTIWNTKPSLIQTWKITQNCYYNAVYSIYSETETCCSPLFLFWPKRKHRNLLNME